MNFDELVKHLLILNYRVILGVSYESWNGGELCWM
jgi:hypothetical protein